MQESDDIERAVALAARVDGVGNAIERGGDPAAALLRRILRRGFANAPLNDLPLEDDAGFALLRGAGTAMREMGRYESEAAMWRHAFGLRPWPLFQRRLSIALLRLGDLASARAIADAVNAENPQGINERFERHWDDLAGAEWLIEEIRAPAKPKRKPAPDAPVAYCLHNCLPFATGGYAMRSHALAAAICQTGRKLITVARPGFPSDSDGATAELADSAQIDAVAYRFENGFGRRGRSFGYIREATDYFVRVFEERDIGIVHAATNFWTALPAGLAARRLGLPFIYEVRSFWSMTREATEPGFRQLSQAHRDDRLEEIALSLADRVLALNSAMAGELAEFGVDPARVAVVPNCVDTDRFRPGPPDPDFAGQYGLTPDRVVIGYIGAMRRYEGLDLLVDAVTGLAADNPALKLLIFGADPALVKTPGTVEHRLAARIGQSDAIRLLPPVPPEAVPALYRCFDICAYPRRGFAITELVPPLKPLEAMASGKPVAISDVGGMRDLVEHEQSGLIFAKNDAVSLADTLARLAADHELRDRLGKAARRFVASERRWRDAAATVDSVYRELHHSGSDDRDRTRRDLVEALFGAGAGS